MTRNKVTDALRGIELTQEGKQEMRDIVFIHDEERAEVIYDQVRYFIMQVLRRGIDDTLTTETKDPDTGKVIRTEIERGIKRYAMSVVEIVKMAKQYDDIDNITKNQVYHHLPKLIEAGIVMKYGTVVTGKRTTDYYRRTAKGFVTTAGLPAMTDQLLKRKIHSHVEKISVFDITLSEIQKKELANLMLEAVAIENKGRAEIAKLVKGDVADKEILTLYEDLVTLYAIGKDEWLNIQRKIREILLPDK